MRNFIIGAVAGIILAVGGVAIFHSVPFGGQLVEFGQVKHPDGAYFGTSNQSVFSKLGAFTTTASTTLATTTFNGLVTNSPNAIATTTTGGVAATLSQADLLAAQFYSVAISQAADFTYTLPASNTLTTLLPNLGESAQWCFGNSTTTSGIDLIFVAGTGIDLEMASSSGSNQEMIGPNDSGCLTLQRKANTDLFARFMTFDDSD